MSQFHGKILITVDVEGLARAIVALRGDDPDEVVETTDGNVSVLDYPQEWYDTPRNIATSIFSALEVKEREYPQAANGEELNDIIENTYEFDIADNMCSNCITPWKCNGPHIYEETVAAKRNA